MNDLAKISHEVIFDELKQEVQRDFLRVQARFEVIDILSQAFERVEALGFGPTIELEEAATGGVHICLDVMLTTPDVRGRVAEIRPAQVNCPESQPVVEPVAEPVAEPVWPSEAPVAAKSSDDYAMDPVSGPSVRPAPASEPLPTKDVSARADLPKVWTPEEDSQAVAIYAKAMAGGLSKAKAIERVSEELGRPFFGVQFRFKTKLGKLVAKAMAETATAAKPAVVEVKPVAPDAKRTPSVSPSAGVAIAAPIERQAPVIAAAPDVSATPPKGQGSDAVLSASGRMPFSADIPARQREWRAQMNVLGNPDPFTPSVDVGLVSDLLSGIHLNHISADLGIDSKVLRNRWESIISPFSLPKGGIALSDQAHLMAELKARAMAGDGVAK